MIWHTQKKKRMGRIIIGHSMKLWTIFWGHGEHEWPLSDIFESMKLDNTFTCILQF